MAQQRDAFKEFRVLKSKKINPTTIFIMKKKSLAILFSVLLIIGNINAQEKPLTPLKLTFNCANQDNSILKSDINNCKKFILIGNESENYKLISANISITIKGTLKEVRFVEADFSEDFIALIKTLSPGSKLFIEKIQIENTITKEKKKISNTTLLIK